MADLLTSVLIFLQTSLLGEIVRNVGYVYYPLLEAVHILGIALLVGPAFTFDFRVLGVGNRVVSISTAAHILLPISHVGLAVTAATGIALLSTHATVIANSGAASWKFGLVILAGLNILIFHHVIYRGGMGRVDAEAPIRARISAAVSLATWTCIIFAGRLLAYT